MEFNKVLENYLSTIDTDPLDRLKELVDLSITNELGDVDSKLNNIESSNSKYSHIHRESLVDDALTLFTVKDNFNALSIIGLYRLIEEKHKQILPEKIKSNGKKVNYSFWDNVNDELPQTIKSDESYRNIDELRLINNAIKHGSISDDLYIINSKFGDVGDELDYRRLEGIYNQMKSYAEQYVRLLFDAFNK
jgi:hypothetical protein